MFKFSAAESLEIRICTQTCGNQRQPKPMEMNSSAMSLHSTTSSFLVTTGSLPKATPLSSPTSTAWLGKIHLTSMDMAFRT